MRLSDLNGKEVINLGDGARLGVITECEITFDSLSGAIRALVLPKRRNLFGIFGENQISMIPWQSIKRIGDDIIIVDLSQSFENQYS